MESRPRTRSPQAERRSEAESSTCTSRIERPRADSMFATRAAILKSSSGRGRSCRASLQRRRSLCNSLPTVSSHKNLIPAAPLLRLRLPVLKTGAGSAFLDSTGVTGRLTLPVRRPYACCQVPKAPDAGTPRMSRSDNEVILGDPTRLAHAGIRSCTAGEQSCSDVKISEVEPIFVKCATPRRSVAAHGIWTAAKAVPMRIGTDQVDAGLVCRNSVHCAANDVRVLVHEGGAHWSARGASLGLIHRRCQRCDRKSNGWPSSLVMRVGAEWRWFYGCSAYWN